MDMDTGIGTYRDVSSEVQSSATDLFSPPLIDVSYKSRHPTEIRPCSEHVGGPFTFIIPAENTHYLDAETFRLHGKFRVMKIKDDGSLTSLTASDHVSVVNLAPQSLFRQATVSMNGREVSYSADPQYPLKCYIETVNSFDEEASKMHLYGNRFKMDTVDHFDTTKLDTAGVTSGMHARKDWIAESKWVDFATGLHIDVFNTSKLYVPGIEYEIQLDRTDDKYTLLTSDAGKTTKYKIEIKDLRLKVDFVELNEKIVNEHKRLFAADNGRGRATYEITRNIIRTRRIKSQAATHDDYNVFQVRNSNIF